MLDVRIDAVAAVVDGVIRPASIGIAGGRIVSIDGYGRGPEAMATIPVEAPEVLLPGLVDTHVHLDEPGHPDWEGFDSGTSAAAAGGITTLVDMPLDCIPVTTDVEALDLKRRAARGQCRVDVGFWAGLVPGNLDQLAGLHAAGALGFKCFLVDSGTPAFPPVDEATLRAGLVEIARLGVPLLVHAEHAATLEAVPRPHGRRYADFLASRPDSSEQCAIDLVIDLVRAVETPAHIVHVSSAASLDRLAQARAHGLPITAETCPHYLVLDAESVPDGATEYACCPPIRSAANADGLWAGLLDGTLDQVVSDHSPAAVALKHRDTGDFGRAWGGISSLQLGLSLIWTAARRRGIGLPVITRWMATAPADLAGLTDRGRIAIGARADLCVFDPTQEWSVEPDRLQHRQPLTPYAGARLTGRITRTLLAGRLVTVTSPARGQLIERREVAACG